ncbi:MAG: NAD(P)-dependent oxidoreductase [Prolixibacteraceae bacterium]|nr:NAD(P)-dependent oxidoreductase [Prolixibacteraceae bacterium]
MNVLLIGGTGFLGSRISMLLIERKHQVTVLSRNPDKPVSFDKSKVAFIKGDISDARSLNVAGSFDVVVYAAMVPFKPGRVSKKKFTGLKKLTRLYFENTIELARKLKCPLILTSGVSFETGKGEVANETWPITRKGMAALGKCYDELVAEIKTDNTIPLIEMLPAQIYGNGGMFSKMINMARSGRVVILGNGKNCIPKVHVDDCARAYLLAIEKLPVGGRYIVADDANASVEEFMRFMAKQFGTKRVMKIPTFILRLVVGKYVFKTLTMHTKVSNALIKSELGWKPEYPTFREGLEQIASTFEQNAAKG